MDQKNPYSSPAELQPGMLSAPAKAAGIEAILPLYGAKGWIKLLGIMNIVMGAIYCLTIFGAIVGWLFIWIGVLLTKSANYLELAIQHNSTESAYKATTNLATLFTIYGVLFLIGLGLMLLYIGFMVIVFLTVAIESS